MQNACRKMTTCTTTIIFHFTEKSSTLTWEVINRFVYCQDIQVVILYCQKDVQIGSFYGFTKVTTFRAICLHTNAVCCKERL